MKKVVLFKSVSEEYQKAFSEHNYETVFVEPLQFTFLNIGELNEKLERGEYAGLVLTSPRAIEAVAECWHPNKFITWTNKKIYTVGDASKKKIQALLGLDARGEATGNAENLAKLIISENDESSKFLFPCGNLRSETIIDILQANGHTVDALTVYETKENENLKANLMDLSDGDVGLCGMVFFSPSGCEYIHRQLQTFSNHLSFLPHFAIGNSTAHKIENLGVEIAGVADKPKAHSMVESVQKYFMTSEAQS